MCRSSLSLLCTPLSSEDSMFLNGIKHIYQDEFHHPKKRKLNTFCQILSKSVQTGMETATRLVGGGIKPELVILLSNLEVLLMIHVAYLHHLKCFLHLYFHRTAYLPKVHSNGLKLNNY